MTDRKSGAQRGWPKGAIAQMGLPSKWSGAEWRGRQPEPTPSFTKSPLQFPPLSSRGHSPVAIHCEPASESTNPDTRTPRHDGLPRPFVPRNDNVVSQNTTDISLPLGVLARAKPVAIHCEPRNEPVKPDTRISRHDGLPRQTEVFLAMTECVVIARAQPVAIHCEPASEPTKPERSPC
jgi:hypothetical protein